LGQTEHRKATGGSGKVLRLHAAEKPKKGKRGHPECKGKWASRFFAWDGAARNEEMGAKRKMRPYAQGGRENPGAHMQETHEAGRVGVFQKRETFTPTEKGTNTGKRPR